MCIICVEYNKGKLTIPEAMRALGEVINSDDITPEHIEEVFELLDDEE